MAEESSTGSNLIWAVTLLIIVAMLGFIVFKSGILTGGSQKKEIDINVTAPSSR